MTRAELLDQRLALRASRAGGAVVSGAHVGEPASASALAFAAPLALGAVGVYFLFTGHPWLGGALAVLGVGGYLFLAGALALSLTERRATS